jgi:hypothetical protein
MKVIFSTLILLPIAVKAFTIPTSQNRITSKSERSNSPLLIQGGVSLPRRRGNVSMEAIADAPVEIPDDGEEVKEIKSKLTKEFFTIAVPAFFQLCAEPLASLVDTAYLGRLGPEVLGGAGVAISGKLLC